MPKRRLGQLLSDRSSVRMETVRLACRPSEFDDSLKEAMLSQSFADVALCCPGGPTFLAHRVVLSAVSPYLQVVLPEHSEREPTSLILADVEGAELSALLGLVYTGRAELPADRLGAFWRAYETLQIRLPIERQQPEFAESQPARRSTVPRPQVANHVTASPWSQTYRPYHSPRLQPMLRLSLDDVPAAQPVDGNNNDDDTGSGTNATAADEKATRRRWRCQDCGKEFSQLRNYKYHRSAVHEGTREFAASCDECGKRFKDRGYLKSHMKIHLNRKEYGCAECGARFNQRVAYNVHVRAHSGLKPHRCEQCGKGFGRRTLLRQHLRTHSGERPYVCPHCQRAFADRSNMALHARLHSGLRPHRCSLCPKAFSKKHHLTAHLNCHTGSKPYACPHCRLGFSQSSNMRTHAKKCALRLNGTSQPTTAVALG